jgi:Bacterial protein of unknown function (DUF882)
MRWLAVAAFALMCAGSVGGVAAQEAEPESIAEADANNIFRRYQVSLLQPAPRCWELETIDESVRQVVEDAAKHFGSVAKVTSCYRSPAYNKALYTKKVKVKRRVVTRVLRLAFTSLHIQRRAVDFFIEGVARDALAGFARSHPLMKDRGGVGRYRGTDIVHIDSGRLRNWCWRCGKKENGDTLRAIGETAGLALHLD